jgi:hypothetical protein
MEQNNQILDSQELNPVAENEVQNNPEPKFPWSSLILLFLGVARLAQGKATWGMILLLIGFGSLGYYFYEKSKVNN